jgi:hypothetical protein
MNTTPKHTQRRPKEMDRGIFYESHSTTRMSTPCEHMYPHVLLKE